MLRENAFSQLARASLNWSEVGRLIALSGGSCVGDMGGRSCCRGQSRRADWLPRGSTRELLMAAFAVIAGPNIREISLRASLKRAKQ
jgi:hypothetical protein